jgi:Ser/Thr protein kinase RdoA (MazF antagonist)
VRRPLAWMAARGSIAAPFQGRYAAAAVAVAELAEARMAGLERHLIHADLHLGNLLLRDRELRVLDFDDMTLGPPVQDLWLALPGRDPDTLRQREVFLDAYQQLRGFDRSTLELIEPLRGLRMVRYAGWLAQRWHDPAFKLGWPHFGTVEFWRDETEGLEAQLSVIRGELAPEAGSSRAPASAPRHAEGEGLTNKDYFFDWEE